MTYDDWKCTDPRDSEPDPRPCDNCKGHGFIEVTHENGEVDYHDCSPCNATGTIE